MLRRIQYDDKTERLIVMSADSPLMVEMIGGKKTEICVVFHIESAADVDRAEKVLAAVRDMVAINETVTSEPRDKITAARHIPLGH